MFLTTSILKVKNCLKSHFYDKSCPFQRNFATLLKTLKLYGAPTVAITSLVSQFLYAHSTPSQSPALFLNFCMQTVHNHRNHQPFLIFLCEQYATVAITSLVSHFFYANSTQPSQSPTLFLNFCMQTVHNRRNHQLCFSLFVCKQYTTVAITSLVSQFLYANSTQPSQSSALFLTFCMQTVHNRRNHQPCFSLFVSTQYTM